ncbi:MAG: flavin-containing monooxygenase, partial [Panacagrimonas sp.]
MSASKTPAPGTNTYDAIVIGAGVAGMYQLHRLREMGLKVLGLEAGSNVGGTWYWNRYPGARFDSQGEIYQYWFCEQLYKSWSPSERFPAQPETERWLNFVADKLDLRKDYQFNTRVSSAAFNEDTNRWLVTTQSGEQFDAQFFVTCTGMLSAPLTDMFPGQKTFKGQLFHTARWPKESVDFKGKRVGVIGIGATGIQVIQTIVPEVEHLTVFVRTPQYITPMRNPKYSEEHQKALHGRYDELKQQVLTSFAGFDYDLDNGSWHDATPEQRRAVYERLWEDGSL